MKATFKRIAVVRTCALGDAVQCTPLLRQIHADSPDARLTFFTSANVSSMFAGAPWLNEVVPLDPAWLSIPVGRRGMLRAWWEVASHGSFDALVSLEPTWMRNLGSLLVRSPVKAGLSFTGKRKPFELFTHPLRVTGDPRETTTHASQQYLDLWTGLAGAEDRGFGYDMRHLLAVPADLPPLPDKPFIVIAPGTGNAFLQVSTKQWPLASFVDVGLELAKQGWAVVYLGGPGDLGSLQPPPGTSNLLGKTSIPQAAAILNRAAAMCGNDSGLFHLAQGLGCPALGLFGSTSPRFTGVFRAESAQTVQAELPCAGCYLHECAPPESVQALGLERPCCMHAISGSQVVQELGALTRAKPSSSNP